MGVAVGTGVCVGVDLGVGVAVGLGVSVGVGVGGNGVEVGTGVGEGVGGMAVDVGDTVGVGVGSWVGVAVGCGVDLGVAVGFGVGRGRRFFTFTKRGPEVRSSTGLESMSWPPRPDPSTACAVSMCGPSLTLVESQGILYGGPEVR